MSGLTLEQLASHLKKDLVGTVQYIHQNSIPFTTIDSIPHFNLEKLPKQPVRLSKPKNKFVLDYIETGRREVAMEGVLKNSSGFAAAFEEKFGEPVVPYLGKMRERRLIKYFPRDSDTMIVPMGPKGYFLNNTTTLAALCEEEQSQLQKDSGNYRYPNKASWRQEFMNFCRDNLTIGPETTALCLGGYGDEIQVYEQLGITPEKIFVMEMDRNKALYIHDKFPQVNLYFGNAIEFLEGTDKEFDLIMIDDDGPLKTANFNMSVQAVRRLKDEAIFGLNVLGRRETNTMKDTYMEMFLFPDEDSSVSELGFQDSVPDDLLDGKTYIPLRSRGISAFLMRCLLEPNTHSINRAMVDALPKKTVQEINEELHNSSPDSIMGYIRTNLILIDKVNGLLEEKGLPLDLGVARALYTSNLHHVQNHARVIYQTTMGNNDYYSDFIKVSKSSKEEQKEQISRSLGNGFDSFKRFVYGQGKAESIARTYNTRLSSDEQRDLHCRIVDLGVNLRSQYKGLFLADNLPPRKLVKGSDYALPDEVKYDVVAMMLFGLENPEIVERFPGLERRIGAIRMNYNNGSYNKIIGQLKEE